MATEGRAGCSDEPAGRSKHRSWTEIGRIKTHIKPLIGAQSVKGIILADVSAHYGKPSRKPELDPFVDGPRTGTTCADAETTLRKSSI